MAKLVIPRQSFIDMNSDTEQYQIRYRISTDDKNVVSYWSPTYSINPELYFVPGSIYSTGRLSLSHSSSKVSAAWDSVSIRKSLTDGDIDNSYFRQNISSASHNAGVITYNVNNNFVVGQTVSVYNFPDYRFNFEEGLVNSATSSSFTFLKSGLANGLSSSNGKVIGKSIQVAELTEYDVWIRWLQNGSVNPSPWIYKERISSTSVELNVPTSYEGADGLIYTTAREIQVEVYRPGTPIKRNNVGPFLMYSGTLTW